VTSDRLTVDGPVTTNELIVSSLLLTAQWHSDAWNIGE